MNNDKVLEIINLVLSKQNELNSNDLMIGLIVSYLILYQMMKNQ